MRVFVDTADLDEIEKWNDHPWVSGFTTNPTLFKSVGVTDPMVHAKEIVRLTDKPVSLDGPPEVHELGEHVWRKIVASPFWVNSGGKTNWTAVCHLGQLDYIAGTRVDIVSVFAGRIMDTGRDPQPVIDAARQTGAQVLWASVREPYNIVQAEAAGCDIVTVPPAILTKYLEWQGRPLERVAELTIAQFEADQGQW